LAAPFDVSSLRLRGDPVPIVEKIMQTTASGGFGLGGAHFSFSNNGFFVYIRSGASDTPLNRLACVDRAGTAQPLPLPLAAYAFPRISPDGRSVAVGITGTATGGTPAKSDIWIYDLMREALIRFTSEGINNWPIWTPDGKRVTFSSNKLGSQNIFLKS